MSGDEVIWRTGTNQGHSGINGSCLVMMSYRGLEPRTLTTTGVNGTCLVMMSSRGLEPRTLTTTGINGTCLVMMSSRTKEQLEHIEDKDTHNYRNQWYMSGHDVI